MRPFALSMGDPAGIGPEITIKAWQALRASPEHAFAVIAPAAIFAQTPHRIISEISEAKDGFSEALPILEIDATLSEAGEPSAANASAIIESIEQAVSLCLSGHADGLITNPIAKHMLYDCLLYTSPSPRDLSTSRMPSSA